MSSVDFPMVKPPSRPRKQMLFTPRKLASSIARSTFLDLPLVVKQINTSPFPPKPHTCRANTSSKL
jgi:hypothetical protein